MPGRTATRKVPKSLLPRLISFDSEIRKLCQQSEQLTLLDLSNENFSKTISVIGLDEVGRGCLAGPVVAAAVELPELDPDSQAGRSLSKLNDSKLLAAEERLHLSSIIKEIAVYAVAEASVEEIDSINILQASLLAMKRARQSIASVSPAVLLVDGNKRIPGLGDRQLTVVKGDSKSASIAAASIIAKVHRDSFMCELSKSFPEYFWHDNKGYASDQHREAIRSHGITPWHRRSFNMEY